jgi:hypothetical protein
VLAKALDNMPGEDRLVASEHSLRQQLEERDLLGGSPGTKLGPTREPAQAIEPKMSSAHRR